MLIFADTADIGAIRAPASARQIDGLTTNPSHVAGSKRASVDVIAEIAALVEGPVSAEVAATDYESRIRGARGTEARSRDGTTLK